MQNGHVPVNTLTKANNKLQSVSFASCDQINEIKMPSSSIGILSDSPSSLPRRTISDNHNKGEINNNGDVNSRDSHSPSSGSDDDVAKECRKLQRQRSSIFPGGNGLYDYRLLMQSVRYGQSSRKRKLILHVDIRNTILVADSITNVSVEEALNSFLTAVVWGQFYEGAWHWYSDIPSLKAPAPCLKTYYKYLEKKMVSNQDDRVKLRLKTGDFVHTSRGQQFLKHFNVHLARMAWQYPETKDMDKVLTMSGKDGRPYHYILPSFYNLLQYLTQKKRDFAIVLRTYGRDCENVLSSLHYGTQGNHPAFRTPLNLPVNKKPGIINRSKHGFSLRTFKSKNHSETQHMLSYDRDIYRHFCASKGISGYVDDFLAWQSNSYCYRYGKPFWIDPTDTRHHHIFFDDNFRSDDDDSIVDVRLFSKENPGLSQSLSHSEVQRYEDACLVQADLLESIADESYFIRMVRMCEDKYSRLIREEAL